MDVFALQEELDASKVARASQARNSIATSSARQAGKDKDSDTRNSSGVVDDGQPPLLIRDDDTGLVMAASALHPHSAEYKLRQRYFVFTDDMIGRGAFGEVLLAQLRDAPILGNCSFVPVQTLLTPSVTSKVGASTMGASTVQMALTMKESISMNSPNMREVLGHGLSMSAVSLGGVNIQLPQALSSWGNPSSGAIASPVSSSYVNGAVSPTSRGPADVPFFAVKRVDKSRTGTKGLSQLYSEVETLSLLNHSNIVRLHEVFQDQKQMFIVMEYVKGGELGKVLKRVGRFSEPVARKMCLSILLAVEYIHEKGIVHRDLKPANCLLTKETVFSSTTAYHFAQVHAHAHDGASSDEMEQAGTLSSTASAVTSPATVMPTSTHSGPLEFSTDDFVSLKIADFGFAALVGRAECLTSYCGTMHYMAPEVAGREGTNYGKPVDLWSFGVIAYNLLSGDFPFTGSTNEKLVESIRAGEVAFRANPKTGENVWPNISANAKDFIEKLLVVDPNRRLTAQEALRHPWIRVEYSDEDLGDYPTTKGFQRAHSKFMKSRTLRHRLLGCFQAVIAAHRLVFLARLQAMRREGIAEIPLLRHFPFMVHGRFEPPHHIASASSKRFANNIPALKRFTDMVAASHTVEVFDVSGNSIDDLGLVQHIVKVSFAHPSLVHLNMERNPIPSLAARALLRLARSPSHRLTIINVNHTSLGADVIAQIDACLKETIRKRTEGASGNHNSIGIVASSSILRHDGNMLRLGLMQNLTTATQGPSPSLAAVTSPYHRRASSPLATSVSPTPNLISGNFRPPSSLGPTPHRTVTLQSNSVLSPLARPSHTILLRRAAPSLPPLQQTSSLADSVDLSGSHASRLRPAERLASGAGVNVVRQNISAPRR